MARNFNGTSDKIINTSIGSSLIPQHNATNWTVSLWTQPNSGSVGVATPCMFAMGVSGGGYNLQIQQTGTSWQMFNNAGNSDLSASGGTVTANTWYNIIVTLGSGTATFYVNGTSTMTTGSIVAWGRAATANDYSAGKDDPDNANFWAGNLADIGVWPGTTLTAGEISALAKGARPFTVRPASLSFYWPFDGLQSPEPDLSGNANNGTLTGTALAAGPPIMQFTPRSPLIFLNTAAAAPSFQAAWAMRNRIVVEGIGT